MNDMTAELEVWMPVGNGCFVSSLGRVRGVTGRVLRPLPHMHGYILAHVSGLGKVYVHRLVCEAFHGPAPGPKYQVDHRNSVRSDNRAVNLRWVTKIENLAHRRPTQGSRSPHAKLTESDVIAIRSAALAHMNNVEVARQFNVRRETIRDIRNWKQWRHLQ